MQNEQRPSVKPNILIIIADQVRWDALGAYGLNPMELTPNLDAMARRGTLYRNMFTNQPVCSPSRGSLFTGQYPAKNTASGKTLRPVWVYPPQQRQLLRNAATQGTPQIT